METCCKECFEAGRIMFDNGGHECNRMTAPFSKESKDAADFKFEMRRLWDAYDAKLFYEITTVDDFERHVDYDIRYYLKSLIRFLRKQANNKIAKELLVTRWLAHPGGAVVIMRL